MSYRIVNTSGAAIQVTESGAGEPSFVFLHYWGGSSRTWRDVIDRLGGSMTNVYGSDRPVSLIAASASRT
jgi:pimeloyl-ACP methyl ester carboxylesterase